MVLGLVFLGEYHQWHWGRLECKMENSSVGPGLTIDGKTLLKLKGNFCRTVDLVKMEF